MFCNPVCISKLVLFRLCQYGSGHGLPQPLLPVCTAASDDVFYRYALFIAQTGLQHSRAGKAQPVAAMTEPVCIGPDKANIPRKGCTAVIDGRSVAMALARGQIGPDLFQPGKGLTGSNSFHLPAAANRHEFNKPHIQRPVTGQHCQRQDL